MSMRRRWPVSGSTRRAVGAMSSSSSRRAPPAAASQADSTLSRSPASSGVTWTCCSGCHRRRRYHQRQRRLPRLLLAATTCLILLVVVVALPPACLAGVVDSARRAQDSHREPLLLEQQPVLERRDRALLSDDEARRADEGEQQQRDSRSNAELDLYDEAADDEEEEYVELNVTAEKWKYLGSPCDATCNPSLQHVFCDPETKFCECEKLYPVQLGPTKGCAKPKKLGEQCLYRATCVYTDQHSTCTQVQHNAVCECEAGYHRVALSRPNKKLFCGADLVLIATDLPTLLGVASGIAVLTGLICFVLKLFSRARYTRPRHYANAGHAPPMLFSSDTGIPLTIHTGRPSSRSSQRSSGGTIGCMVARKPSNSGNSSGGEGGARGPLVPQSRAGAARAAAILLISCHRQAAAAGSSGGGGPNGAGGVVVVGKHRRALSDVAEGSSDGLGSRRPSLASLHSSTSSAKSYSARRLERERNDKEQRLALVELKLKREQQQQQQRELRDREQRELSQQPVAPTPSPRTPHSTDELLPSVEEATEIYYNEQIPTTSGTLSSATSRTRTTTAAHHNNDVDDQAMTPLFEIDRAVACTSSAGAYHSS